MSVLAKGMKMSRNCGECLICLDDSRIANGYCMIFHRAVDMAAMDKQCPLVPAPKHGELIDLSTVKLHDGPYEYADWVEWALEQYQDAPIFAPADTPKEESNG